MTYHMIADSCPDGPCPKIRIDEGSGDVYVQGYLTDREPGPTPTGEGHLRIPAADWTRMLNQLRA